MYGFSQFGAAATLDAVNPNLNGNNRVAAILNGLPQTACVPNQPTAFAWNNLITQSYPFGAPVPIANGMPLTPQTLNYGINTAIPTMPVNPFVPHPMATWNGLPAGICPTPGYVPPTPFATIPTTNLFPSSPFAFGNINPMTSPYVPTTCLTPQPVSGYVGQTPFANPIVAPSPTLVGTTPNTGVIPSVPNLMTIPSLATFPNGMGLGVPTPNPFHPAFACPTPSPWGLLNSGCGVIPNSHPLGSPFGPTSHPYLGYNGLTSGLGSPNPFIDALLTGRTLSHPWLTNSTCPIPGAGMLNPFQFGLGACPPCNIPFNQVSPFINCGPTATPYGPVACDWTGNCCIPNNGIGINAQPFGYAGSAINPLGYFC